MEAVNVLEAVLQSSTHGNIHVETHPNNNPQDNGITNNVPRSYPRRPEDSPQRILVPTSSFKSRNSSQQLWAGPVSPEAADILPSRSDRSTYYPTFYLLINLAL